MSPAGEPDQGRKFPAAGTPGVCDEERPEEEGVPGLLFKVTANVMFSVCQGVCSLQ